MITYEKSILINHPQQDVWDYLSNPANYSKWQRGAEPADWTSEGPPGVGSTIGEALRVLGWRVESPTKITAWDPPNEYARKSVGGLIPWEATFTLEPNEDSTQLTVRAQGEIGGLFKFVEGLVEKPNRKQLDANLQTLKRLLEEGQA